jgi:hypothetical protein
MLLLSFDFRNSPIQREQIDHDTDENDGDYAHHDVDLAAAAQGVGHFNGLSFRQEWQCLTSTNSINDFKEFLMSIIERIKRVYLPKCRS